MQISLSAVVERSNERQMQLFGKLLVELACLAPIVDVTRRNDECGLAQVWEFDIDEAYVDPSFVRHFISVSVAEFNATCSQYAQNDPRYGYIAWSVEETPALT